MAIIANFAHARYDDGLLTIEMIPPVPIGGS